MSRNTFHDGTMGIARMWCPGCQTDVAGEISADGQSLLCATCGGELTSAKTLSLHPRTREIRQLLDRWSTEELLDPDLPVRFTPPPAPAATQRGTDSSEDRAVGTEYSQSRDDAAAVPELAATADDRSDADRRRKSRPKFRLDDQHFSRIGSAAPVPAPHPRRKQQPSPQTRFDAAHTQTPPPHFNIASAFDGGKTPGRGESFLGQILAYVGILVLTAGTAMVVGGYFGGRADLTPTGWLLATAGQFLLFLGVVTLVSGGMEQTTHEVSRRIQVLGDQLLRIERHNEEQLLRGPHFSTSEEPARRQRMSAESHDSTAE